MKRWPETIKTYRRPGIIGGIELGTSGDAVLVFAGLYVVVSFRRALVRGRRGGVGGVSLSSVAAGFWRTRGWQRMTWRLRRH